MGVVARQSILTSIISYAGVVVGYINLLYLYPKYLEPNELGLLRTIQDAAMLFVPFAQVGLAQSIVKFFPQFSNNDDRGNGFVSLTLLLSLIGFGIFLLVFFLLEDVLLSFFLENAGEIIHYVNLVLGLTFLLVVITVLEFYSRSLLKIAFPNFLREIGIRLMQALLVGLYVMGVITFNQLLIYSVAIYVLNLVVLVIYLIRTSNFRFSINFTSVSWIKLRQILSYSSLSFIGTGAMILIAKMDSLMVSGMLGFSLQAVYTTAFYMATVIEIPKRALSQAAMPIIAQAFERGDKAQIESIYQKISINQLLIGLLLLIGLWINIQNVFDLVPRSETYRAGAYVVLIIGAGKLIDMAFGPSSEIIVLSKYYWFNIIVVSILAVVTIVANIFLIPRYGVNGAALGTAVALLLFNSVKYIFLYVVFRIQPFRMATLAVLMIGSLVVLINYFLPTFDNVFIDIGFRSSVVTLVYGGAVLITRVSEEVNTLAKQSWLLLVGKR